MCTSYTQPQGLYSRRMSLGPPMSYLRRVSQLEDQCPQFRFMGCLSDHETQARFRDLHRVSQQVVVSIWRVQGGRNGSYLVLAAPCFLLDSMP